MFNLKKFRRPDAIHAPGYFWFLNAAMDEETLRWQIQDMARAGARTICPHPLPPHFRDFFMSQLTPEYLSEEYFKKYQVIADECAKLGLSCYLYDEGGWPSGMACGKVWQSDPEKYTRINVVRDPDDPKGVKFVREEQVPGRAERPDILVDGAVEKFLELTHEQYNKYIGEHFGKTFHFTFMDEPEMPRSSLNQLCWTPDFAEAFKAKKGYDIFPHLRAILDCSSWAEDQQHRIDFCDVCSQLFVERFMLPIRDWCRKHNLLSGGHMGGEDALENMAYASYGHILRTLRCLDFPGVDVIWRQVWMGVRLPSFPKLASSVANQGGNRFVSGEMFGVYGNGLTFDQMRFLIDYFVVCGVNTFIVCTKPLATTDGLGEGERPFFGPVNPQWQHIKPYHEYTSRISMLCATGKPAVDTALFLDAYSLWASPESAKYADRLREKIADMLMERQVDFDYIDDDALAEAKIKNGKLAIGKARYSRLVIPVGARFAEPAAKRLKQLRAAGFPVLTQDEIASIPATLETGDWRLRVRKHTLRGGSAIYFVFNTSAVAVKASLKAVEKAPVARFDCENGKLYRAGKDGKWDYEFAPYRVTAFLVGSDAEKAEAAPAAPGKVIAKLDKKWRIRPEVRYYVGEHDYVIEKVKTAAKAVKPGCWEPVLGKDFSGTAVYTTTFESDGKAAFLDLGEVKYSAEVRLNGKKLGIRTYAPYVFDISEAVQPGVNRLEVRVVNTLANAILADGVWEQWQKLPFEGPYENRQQNYEKESLDSGLYGPVTLKESVK